ncbi:mCG147042 [Mus musculus]|jgi:hypothetical protein|nr:mCG147042 [Mus musculus]
MIDYLLENEYKNSIEGEKSASSLKSGSIPHCLPSSPDIQAALISLVSKKSGPGSLSFGFNYTKMLNKNPVITPLVPATQALRTSCLVLFF